MITGLDIGTTAVKALTVDADGTVCDRAERDGDAVDAALALISDGPVCLSSAMHALVGLDARDRPVTPLLDWADLRATEQAERLKREHPALHARTGTPLHPMSPLCKLVHWREQGVTARRWVGVKELVMHRLTGEWVADRGSCRRRSASAT